MELEHLTLNDLNTENGEIPRLTDEMKRKIKTIRILENSNLLRNCIPNSAFFSYSSLESVRIEDGANIATFGGWAFGDCISLQSVNIPNGVTTIEEDAFNGCTSLQSVDIPNSVTRIGRNAFCDCGSLKSISIPSGVTTIEWRTFWDCKSLRSINIPNGMATIGKNAFWYCESLQSFHIPRTVKKVLGEVAFKGCSKLHQRLSSGTNYHPDIEIWLRHRFDNIPIHHACYYVNDDAQSAVDHLSILIQDNHQTLAATDATGMTPLDILCDNSRATVEMVRVLVEKDPSLQQTGLSPFMLAATFPACGLDVVYALAMNDLVDIIL